MKSICFTVRLNCEKELESTVWRREFQQFIPPSFTKEIGMYAVCGLALEKLEFIIIVY